LTVGTSGSVPGNHGEIYNALSFKRFNGLI